MVRSRLIHIIVSLLLVFSVAGGVIATQTAAFAQTATPTPTPTATTPSLSLSTSFPSYSDNSGATFSFDVTVTYNGPDRVLVNLDLAGPQGWTTTLTYNSDQVSAIYLGPSDQFGPDTKTISISMTSSAGANTKVGSYPATLTATSGSLNAKLTLTAIVQAQYLMNITTDSGLLSTNGVVGKTNTFVFKVENKGTAALQNIAFSWTGPTGWNVRFNPTKISSLGAGQSEEVDATFNPPANQTIAGNYTVNVSVTSASGSTSGNLSFRVTILTSSLMEVVAIAIIAVSVLGLMVLFWRLGRV